MRGTSCTTMLLAGTLAVSTAAWSQQKVDLGKREFDNHCAACHGLDAKGNGPYNELLKRSAPELTTMARRNGGLFPVARAYEVIDGAGPGHGGRDMPIWGTQYSAKAADYYIDVPYDREAFVRGRILSLIEYLNRVQLK